MTVHPSATTLPGELELQRRSERIAALTEDLFQTVLNFDREHQAVERRLHCLVNQSARGDRCEHDPAHAMDHDPVLLLDDVCELESLIVERCAFAAAAVLDFAAVAYLLHSRDNPLDELTPKERRELVAPLFAAIGRSQHLMEISELPWYHDGD